MYDDVLTVLRDRGLGLSVDAGESGTHVRILDATAHEVVMSRAYMRGVTIEDAIRRTVELLPK